MLARVCWTAIPATRTERTSLGGGAAGSVTQRIDAAENMNAMISQRSS